MSRSVALSSLVDGRTIRDAASQAGVTECDVADYLADPSFREQLNGSRDAIRQALAVRLMVAASEAVDVVVGIMRTVDNGDAVRLKAAQDLLDRAGIVADRLEPRADDKPMSADETVAAIAELCRRDDNLRKTLIGRLESGKGVAK